jgi:predicted ATPase with chaperone activity
MTLAEAFETTCSHCVAGLASARTAMVTTRPCRVPHHPLSDAGLLGGGHVPMPAEVSLAHHRVRFLDELPPSAAAMSWRSCASLSRRRSSPCNLQSVRDHTSFAD